MSATLQLLQGPEAGRRYEVGETEISIGRGEHCRVLLDDRTISRRQARVYFQGDRYWLVDIGRNRTSLNGRRVEKHAPVALADGDQIGICDWLLEFRCSLPFADDDEALDSSSISCSVDAQINVEAMAQIHAADKLRRDAADLGSPGPDPRHAGTPDEHDRRFARDLPAPTTPWCYWPTASDS